MPGRPGSTFATKQERLLVLAAAGWTCQIPGCGRKLQNTNPKAKDYAHIGHIQAHIDGGAAHLSNYRAECAGCNLADGARITNTRRAAGRPGSLGPGAGRE